MLIEIDVYFLGSNGGWDGYLELKRNGFPLAWDSDGESSLSIWFQLKVTCQEPKTKMMVKSSLGKRWKGIADSLSENKIKGKEINLDRPNRLLGNGGHWIGGSGPEQPDLSIDLNYRRIES